jgi:hypothetical protein
MLVWWALGRGERVGAPNCDHCEGQARHFPICPLAGSFLEKKRIAARHSVLRRFFGVIDYKNLD